MAILKMKKISAIGLLEDKSSFIRDLMDLGAVQISNPDDKLIDKNWSKIVTRDGASEKASFFDGKVTKAEMALDILDKYKESKKPLFLVRKMVPYSTYEDIIKQENKYESEVEEIISLSDEIESTSDRKNDLNNDILALMPWKNYDAPLRDTETEKVCLSLGTLPIGTDIEQIKESLASKSIISDITEISRDEYQIYITYWYLKEDKNAIKEISEFGYAVASFDEYDGIPAEVLDNLQKESTSADERISNLKEIIKSKSNYIEDIQYYHDMMVVFRDEKREIDKLLITKKTFTFDGWIPVKAVSEFKKIMLKYTSWYEIKDPDENDDIPVMMENNKIVSPMEFITKMYSLPSAREVDPTAIYTIFYIIFFGMMFADIGYGIILSLISTIIIKKYKLYEGPALSLMQLLNYCGISSAFWGLMFGSFFGDLISVVSNNFFGKNISLKPLWLNPVENSMTILIFSCAIGLLHLFVGMGIKAYEEIKAGKVLSAINDVFIWYVTIAGMLMWIFGGRVSNNVVHYGKIITLAGFALAIILPIFIEKGVGKAIGFWNIYNGITGNLSDVLSYSRLLGLGLASASIAEVMNFLATLGGKGFVGIIVFILVEIVGHSFNFALNALGSFVHSARLQYVEFFGRFFEGGGKAYKPFKKETKYININSRR